MFLRRDERGVLYPIVPIHRSGEWTCEECTNGLVQIATIFVQQEYIDDIIAFLQVLV